MVWGWLGEVSDSETAESLLATLRAQREWCVVRGEYRVSKHFLVILTQSREVWG